MVINMVKIGVYDKNNNILCEKEEENGVHLLVNRIYQQGDYIRLHAEEKCFYHLSLYTGEHTSTVYAKEKEFVFKIPFGEERMPYPPGAFEGEYHILEMEKICGKPDGICDLSTNPNDIRGMTSFFPHCTASVETRDESVFAARNTIDGFKETDGHGFWPFTSWGDNEDPDAEIKIWFGRMVEVTEISIYLRSDFPHDNYWRQGTLLFSDGSNMDIALQKTGNGQSFTIPNVQCEWVKLCNLNKDENDPSPFPALTYWRVNGREV